MGCLPKNPKKGERTTITKIVKGHKRKMTFEATGKKFPKFKIISNEKA